MKYLIFSTVILFSLFTQAQNVGVGTATPAEKLDVHGNVNITGSLKANGNAGSNGQILMSTGSGFSWGSAMGYKKCMMFTDPGGFGSWTVPAGVTEVMVELWGGGSGGAPLCGGTSGGYARTVQPVAPGLLVAYYVGAGSAGSFGSTNSADSSVVLFPFGLSILASGGGGVINDGSSQTFRSGLPRSGSGTGLDNAFYMYGNSGGFYNIVTTTNTFFTPNSVSTSAYYGNGGVPVGMFNSTPLPGDLSLTTSYQSAPPQNVKVSSHNAVVPSSGGPAGTPLGYNGASGLVIIWFN